MSRVPLLRTTLAGVAAPIALTACVPFGQECVDVREALGASYLAAPAIGGTAAAAPVVRIEPGTTMYSEETALSPDGERLLVDCDGGGCAWDTATGELTEDVEVPPNNLGWAGDVVVGTGYDGDEEQGEVVFTEDQESCGVLAHDLGPAATEGAPSIADLAVSPDGARLASASGRIGLWSVAERERTAWLEPDVSPTAAAWSPGPLLAVGGPDGAAEIWDTEADERQVVLDDVLVELAWSPDGERLAGVRLEDREVVVYDVGTWQRLDVDLDLDEVGSLAWSPDSSRLALTQLDDGTVTAWSPTSGASTVLAEHDEPVGSVLWAPDGASVYTVDSIDGARRTAIVDGEPSGPLERFETPEPIVG